jgi:transcriptional regulator with XRE-family HTH domain
MAEDRKALTPGERIRLHRDRAGMTRPVLGGLVGRSAEWVKAIETGRLLPPRLPMLIRIAQVLGVPDLAELTGEPTLSVATYTKTAHERLASVADVLTDYRLTTGQGAPLTAAELAAQVTQAWTLWHGSRQQRTVIATLLPGLLANAEHSARALEGQERRSALARLAQVHHLAQLFLSFQPRPELVYLTGDRAMTAARDADSPQAIAAAAWYVNHVFRDAGERHEARVSLALDAAGLLRPEDRQEDLALWGLLHLAAALSYAKFGRDGDAWRHWDQADRAARSLGAGYSHPWLIFGPAMVAAYAITMQVDLVRPGEAIRHADRLDLTAIPSATRRSFHLIETARAYSLRNEPVAVLALLRKAHETSPDTTRFNLFTQATALDLAETGGATVRADAAELAESLGLIA